MKLKNFLLVTSFLTLFVFHQAQAGATAPSRENPSQISFAPPYAPLPTINVFVLWLNPITNAIDTTTWGGPHKCVNPYEHHGCGSIDPEQPNAARNPVPITVDPYYLRDVVTIEMNVGEIPPTLQELPALKAQAIAARTVASWKAVNQYYTLGSEGGPGYINNSTQYQVFIPGSYNDYPTAQPFIDTAVSETQGQFLSYFPDGINPDGTRKTIDAEFSSDIIGQSQYGNQGYLQIVQEPISSSTCTVQGTVGNDWGMSQRGAIRWAKGNTCPDESGVAWPVQWDDYRQILVHYYTGIDILDAGGSLITPVDRWNLLWHDNFGSPAGVPQTLNNAQTYTLKLQLQNTSVGNWAENEITLGYQWTPPGVDPDPTKWLELTALPALETGASTPDSGASPLQISIPAPCGTGGYTLHLDAGRGGAWFSAEGWLDARIDVTIQLSTPQAAAGRGYYTDGLGALYYNDEDDGQWVIGGPITWTTFTAPHDYAAVEPNINFDTDISPPRPGVNGTFWSAAWDGNLYVPQTGDYRFYLGGLDDGGRLKIDGTTHIESWVVQGPHEYFSQPINLAQGLHGFTVEYAQGPGEEAGLSVCWEGPGFVKEVIGASGAIPGQPTPTPFIMPTYPPPATPTSDVTPTSPPPTSEPWGNWFAAEEAALQGESATAREEYSNLLSRVRDEVMLPDPKGDAYRPHSDGGYAGASQPGVEKRNPLVAVLAAAL